MSILDSFTPVYFDNKAPEEIVTLMFDFSGLVGALSLSAPVMAISVSRGVDAAAASVLSGTATVTGAGVTQRVQGGVAGVDYRLMAQVDASDGSRYVLTGLLPVRLA